MKAILEFELPIEKDEFDVAVHGGNYRKALRTLDRDIQERINNGSPGEEEYQTLENILSLIADICEECGAEIY